MAYNYRYCRSTLTHKGMLPVPPNPHRRMSSNSASGNNLKNLTVKKREDEVRSVFFRLVPLATCISLALLKGTTSISTTTTGGPVLRVTSNASIQGLECLSDVGHFSLGPSCLQNEDF